jgi:peptidylprolyl isomerase
MSTNAILAVILAVIAVIVAALLVVLRPGGGSAATGTASVGPGLCASIPEALNLGEQPQDVPELKIEDTKVGTGPEALTGDKVEMHYVGRLTNGKQFDASCERGQTFNFPLGGGQVIQGWDSGIVGMKVGGQRRLIIPSKLGYGERGAGADIPAGAGLVFDVELVKIEGK